MFQLWKSLAFAAAALLSASLEASVIYVKADAAGANNGTSWTNAYTSLQTALAQHAAGEFWVAAGTYKPGTARTDTFTVNGRAIYGGFNGTETAGSQRDFANNITILSGEINGPGLDDNCYHVVTLNGGSGATLDGLTITSGSTVGAGSFDYGAGIFAAAPVFVANCRILDNHAGSGAGINLQTDGTVINTVFARNVASPGAGAGISTLHGTNVSVRNCSFSANVSTLSIVDYAGSRFFSDPFPYIQNCIIWGNSGDSITPNNQGTTSSIVEGRDIRRDPLFADPAAGDLHLMPGSPAIDAGSSVDFNIDGDGFPRQSGTAVDIGAFEYSADRLTIGIYGNGTGSVASSLRTCHASCAAGGLVPGDTYQLTATADPGFQFTGWEGACSGTGVCTVHVPASATAHFGHIVYVNGAAAGANDGTSWTNAFTDLQSAIGAATGGDTIWVAQGTYRPSASDRNVSFQLKSNVAIYGGFAGTETTREQRAPSTNITVLSGDIGVSGDVTDNSLTVVNAYQVNQGAILDGFTIRGSNGASFGGGIFFKLADARVSHCTIDGNYAQFGGGFAVDRNGGTLSDCAITNNSGSAAAAYISGDTSFVMLRCTVTNNNSDGGFGVIEQLGGSCLIDSCRIRQNHGGPALYLDSILSGSASHPNAPLVRNCEIVGADSNEVTVYSASGATLLNDTVIATSNALGPGKAVESAFGYPLSVINCIMWGDEIPSLNFYPGTGTNANNISDVDPMFVSGDLVNGGFRIGAGSPAIDAADNTYLAGVSFDIEGKPRFVDDPQTADTGVGTAPLADAGAYEFYPVTVSVPASIAACAGAQITLQSNATGWGTLTYQWKKDGNPVGGATGASYTINAYADATDAGSYAVTVTDSLGTTSSATIDVHAGSLSISGFAPAQGGLGTIVTIDGSGFTGVTSVKFNALPAIITNVTDAQITVKVPGGAVAGPISIATAGCSADSASSFAMVPFGGPPAIATATSQNAIALTWSAVGDTSSYQVMRQSGPSGFQPLAATTDISFTDTTVSPSQVYVYRVHVVQTGTGTPADGAGDLASTFDFTPAIVQNVTPVRFDEWNDLRTAADALHVLAGLDHVSFTNAIAVGEPLRYFDLLELRAVINASLQNLGLSQVSFTTSPQILIRKQDVDEIRGAFQ